MKNYQFWQCYIAIAVGSLAGTVSDAWWGFATGALAMALLIIADAAIEAIKGTKK